MFDFTIDHFCRVLDYSIDLAADHTAAGINDFTPFEMLLMALAELYPEHWDTLDRGDAQYYWLLRLRTYVRNHDARATTAQRTDQT